MPPGAAPDLKRALRACPWVRTRTCPRTTERIDFLVGGEAFETHPGGFVTMRVPVIELDGIDVDQVRLTGALRAVEDGLNRALASDGVPIVNVDPERRPRSSRDALHTPVS